VWDIERHIGIHISLVKRLGSSVSVLDTLIKNCHVIEESANQYVWWAKKRREEADLFEGLKMNV
jgi:hypothetical protein